MKTNERLVFKQQKKQLQHYDKCSNYIGFNVIEIIEFNYDGKGNALILEDGYLGNMGEKELRFLFFSGWYKGEQNGKSITK